MVPYKDLERLLVAVDCIILGFDGAKLKLLLIKRGFEPEKNKWSLMGGFVQPNENSLESAKRVLKQLTGLSGVYLEELRAFSNPDRDPEERILSLAYFALIDINQYQKQLSNDYQAEWFELDQIPTLIFDHNDMVKSAIRRLRYKAALHPLLFELLPEKFTIPQLQILYEAVYDTIFDKRNFSRKVLSLELLVKQKDKEKESSKKGAYFYKLDLTKYETNFQAFLNFIPNAHLYL
ncbi:NUDIX hydrolase [Polluticaenibacter yanchengensis]|uniref:NUDIX domain-containing protein n=1 Tax=Polluticaenibacter yanchengensis TaxID=3014562 RepID=A0ABT4UMV3_9BACT|nr:NUDIX domain-containing protein [Chitinophagaceae bacterium LY-5]